MRNFSLKYRYAFYLFFFTVFCFSLISCSPSSAVPEKQQEIFVEKPSAESKPIQEAKHSLEEAGLQNVCLLDGRILVDLKYASTDNFCSAILYENIEGAYLQPDVAEMLVKAQKYLDSLHPNTHLLVYDAVRPVNVQQQMWEIMKNSKYRHYIADPSRKSLHNYGAAVDLTLADSSGNALDMGTPFDYFGKKAAINIDEELLSQGLLTLQQIENRKLLQKVMRYAGFYAIHGEWWHFNACSLHEAQKRYQLLESL